MPLLKGFSRPPFFFFFLFLQASWVDHECHICFEVTKQREAEVHQTFFSLFRPFINLCFFFLVCAPVVSSNSTLAHHTEEVSKTYTPSPEKYI